VRTVHFALALLLAAGLSSAAAPPAGDDVSTTVMTFNIRYGTADDGPNAWEHRRYLVRLAIRERQPAIFGVQECLWEQGVELERAFSEYRITGVGRDDGLRAGEMCLIFTRRDRYRLLGQGNFWLSDTPQSPGSVGWDAACPRVVTWVELYDRLCDPDTLFVFNTHLDHRGARAREEGALLLRRRMGEIAHGHAALLMGDFNAPADAASPPYRILAQEGWRDDIALHDAWYAASPAERSQPDGTFHGFTGTPVPGRIDWILAGPALPAADAGVSRFRQDGRLPSDHFPVWAVFRQTRHKPRPGDVVDAATGASPRY
jgi:endonuclease/exonuclease/phosphatase family metal-dependent hydrolase